MSLLRVIDFPRGDAVAPSPGRVTLVSIQDGCLTVIDGRGWQFDCDVVESTVTQPLAPGDTLLALPPDDTGRGVVLGRIGPYRPAEPQKCLTIEASEVLTLKCGSASVDLRSDGKLMIQGQDVLLKAKGTQRIKAGSVAIN